MTTTKTPKSYDINYLLIVANILLYGIIIYLYTTTGDTDYVNISTVMIAGLFAVENIGMLLYEKNRRDPLVLLLVLLVTVFYILRIPTLIWSPLSAKTFNILSITVSDLNYALIFILLSNASMFLGFYFGRKNNVMMKNRTYISSHAPDIKNPIIILILLALINFFNLISTDLFGRLSGFVQYVFFNQDIILLLTFTMLAYHYDKIPLRSRVLFGLIILAFVILISLSGSRSGVLKISMLLLISILAVKQRMMLRKKHILICLIMIPIAIMFFITATLKRELLIDDRLSVEQFRVAKESEILNFEGIEKYLSLIYYRIGFLDYSTELIANREKFEKIINGKYYFKSVADNVLSPGFDVFDTVRASHALSYVRRSGEIPASKSEINEAYQSDQMGIYGEYYVLFYGFPALAVFFLLAFMLEKILINLRERGGILSCMYGATLVYLFYTYINSFGSDWFVLTLVSSIITTLLFARFYVDKGKRKFVFRFNRDVVI